MADTWIKTTVPTIVSTLTSERPYFKLHFSALSTNAERVQLCQEQEEVQRWIGDFFVNKSVTSKKVSKCSKIAAKFRADGNVAFKAQHYPQSIPLYSEAIRFAPQSDTDSELVMAYGNRSAAYFQVGQHDNALKDINIALAFGYSRFKSVTKLQLRKCDCLIQLGRAMEAKELLDKMRQPTEDENDRKRWAELFDRTRVAVDNDKNEPPKANIAKMMEKLTQKGFFKSNPKMSSLSAKVAVRYYLEKGRHLVAQEDIQFGDVIAVSRPYATLLNCTGDATKCHHCCRDIFPQDSCLLSSAIRPVPCAGCTVMFCSEGCRVDSGESYHRYECKQYGLLIQLPSYLRMSLRILFTAGLDQIRSVVSAEQMNDSSYCSEQPENHYSHVYHLVHYTDGPLNDLHSYQEMLNLSIYSCLLLQLLKQSHFRVDTKDDEKFIGGILLRHLRQLRFNAFEHSPLHKSSPSTVQMELYPVYASTVNHSCKANARLESPNKENVCLLQATQPIPAGTDITISYLADDKHFTGASFTAQFRRQLFDRYCFECNCVQCTYLNRNRPFGATRYFALSCTDCGNLMERASEQSSEFEIFLCTKCRLAMANNEMIRRYRQLEELACTCSYLIDQLFKIASKKDDPFWAQFESVTEQIEALFHRDSAILVAYQRIMIANYYLNIGQFDKWWACCEQLLSVIEHHFGTESVHLLQALNEIKRSIVNSGLGRRSSMDDFAKQDNELFGRYLARIGQWHQLNRKYNLDYLIC